MVAASVSRGTGFRHSGQPRPGITRQGFPQKGQGVVGALALVVMAASSEKKVVPLAARSDEKPGGGQARGVASTGGAGRKITVQRGRRRWKGQNPAGKPARF